MAESVPAEADPAAVDEVPAVGHGPDTAGGAAVPRPAEPGTAPQHPGRAALGTLRVYGGLCRVIAVPILAPFPDAAVQVEEPPGVRPDPHAAVRVIGPVSG